jgi:hypothetical protein
MGAILDIIAARGLTASAVLAGLMLSTAAWAADEGQTVSGQTAGGQTVGSQALGGQTVKDEHVLPGDKLAATYCGGCHAMPEAVAQTKPDYVAAPTPQPDAHAPSLTWIAQNPRVGNATYLGAIVNGGHPPMARHFFTPDESKALIAYILQLHATFPWATRSPGNGS